MCLPTKYTQMPKFKEMKPYYEFNRLQIKCNIKLFAILVKRSAADIFSFKAKYKLNELNLYFHIEN